MVYYVSNFTSFDNINLMENFHKIKLFVLILLIGWGTPIIAFCEIHWVLQSQAPSVNPDYIAIEKFTRNIKKMTNGRLLITPIAGDSKDKKSKGSGIYNAIKHNKVQMAVGWPNWWYKFDPAWNALQSGPYGFMNIDASMMWYFVGNGTKYANELSNKDGILWRPAWWAGMELGLITQQNIKGLDDLKGKVVRIGPGIPNDTLLAAAPGVRTVTIPSADIEKAFEQGMLHGIEWTVPSATINMGFHRLDNVKANHIIAPAVWQPSVLGDFLINQESFNKLPEDIQAILETAMIAFALTTTLNGKVLDMDALSQFQQEGVHISRWSDKDLKTWKEKSEEVYSVHKKKSKDFERYFNDKMAFKKKYNTYQKTHGAYE